MMGTTGVRIFNNMLSAAGQFGSGIISVLTQLAPLAEWVSAGFKKMGAAFNSWAQSTEGQNAIKSFIEYTKQNLPLIGQIFGNTFKGIFNLMKAFAPNTHSILESLAQMSEKFASWSATVAKSDGFKKFIAYVQENGPKLLQLLGNLVMIIINVATAMAPLASVVLNVALAVTDFIKNLTAANPIIGMMLGILATLGGAFMALYPAIQFVIRVIGPLFELLGGFSGIASIITGAVEGIGAAFAFLTGPVGIIIGLVAAVIAIFVALWNSSSVLRNAVIGAWNAIKSAVGSDTSGDWFLRDLLGRAQEILAPLAPIFQQTWNDIVSIVEAAVTVIAPMIKQAFNTVVAVVKVAWEIIKAVIKIAMEVILGTITALLHYCPETGAVLGKQFLKQVLKSGKLSLKWLRIFGAFRRLLKTIMAKHCRWL